MDPSVLSRGLRQKHNRMVKSMVITPPRRVRAMERMLRNPKLVQTMVRNDLSQLHKWSMVYYSTLAAVDECRQLTLRLV